MTFSFIKMPGATSVNNEPQPLEEKLSGDQHKLDHDKDGDIDGKDFAMLRMKKKNKKMNSPTKDEPEGENGDTAEMNPKMKDKEKKMEKTTKEGMSNDMFVARKQAQANQKRIDKGMKPYTPLHPDHKNLIKPIKKKPLTNKQFVANKQAAINKKKNESIGQTPGDHSYHYLQKAKRMAAKDGHDYDKLPAYDRTHDKHKDYYDQKARMSESKIREALLSVLERSHGNMDSKETMDDMLKGGGAKKMKADMMKGAKMNDTVAKAPEDAKAAGSRGPSAKPRSGGDNTRSGDSKVVQSGTPMKDPASPSQKMESLVKAYQSMKNI